MTPERWRQVTAVFHAALALDAPARAAYLDRACAGDHGLREEVTAMLAAHHTPAGFGDRPVMGAIDGALRLETGAMVGAYRIDRLIGAGGMAEVYRARDTRLGREVALKVLAEAFTADPDRVARFEREARLLAALNHPHIAHLYDVEKSADTYALVMELIDGPTLADRIARGPIPVDEALDVARQIAEALEAAHERGIIHRDLKPANIKVRPDGTVKVLDFGLAKGLEPMPAGGIDPIRSPTITSPAMMTDVGVLLGTAAYMSPEQARGLPVDKRTDIWAFGCVLYEMLTGWRAFEGEDVSMTLSKVLQREPDFELLPAAVPNRMHQTIRLCLRKSLNERVADIHDVRLALEGAFETTAAQPPQSAAVAQPAWRRPLAVAAVAAVVAVIGSGFVTWSLWPAIEPPAIRRFEYVLPTDQGFRRLGRPVLAVSPDGRHFLYNTGKGLYLRTMGELQARLIPGTEEDLNSPFFSPDGESVAYYAFAGSQLKRIPISGGASVKIADATNLYGASWGADGTILFGQPQGIMRVSATAGTRELVIPAKEGEQVDSPQLLPDGDSVLFSVATDASSTKRWDDAQIVVQSLSTGARTVVVQGGSDARYLPTGHLIYAREENLFAVAFDAATKAISGSAVPVVQRLARAPDPAGTTATANYSVSNTGTLVYVAGGLGAYRLVWLDREGRESPLAAPARRYAQAKLSPDGSRVAVVIEGDIWVWDNGRGTLTRLTVDASEEWSPLWTVDGTRIVFATREKGILWMASDGTGESKPLFETNGLALPSTWAPDGTLLYYVMDGIGRLSMAGVPKGETLLDTKFRESRPAVSPDGRWLAYESDESGRFEIYVRPFPNVSGGRWLVSTSGGEEAHWARDGRALFYRTTGAGQRLMSVTVEAKATEFVTHTPEPLFSLAGIRLGGNLRTYDVAPDGERFLFTKNLVGASSDAEGSTSSRVIVVENWFEELKRRVPVN
ncbi:MAG: protein kinase, partial [Vicinamibacterales bacterium]